MPILLSLSQNNMQKYSDVILGLASGSVTPMANATASIAYASGGTPVIYSDNGVTVQANPFTSDSVGRVSFYAADGRYNITVSKAGFSQVTLTDVLLEDPADGGAAQTQYVPAGTGAVATTVQSKLRESVSVKDFGAVGDGVTDDTSAIQAAVLASPGKRINAPKGTYKLSSSIVLASGQTIFGEGKASSVFLTSDAFDAIVLSSSYAGVTGCWFTSVAARTANAYVKINSATRGNFVKECGFTNAFYGIHISANAVITNLFDLEFTNTAQTNGIGIFIAGGNDTFLDKIIMDAPSGSQPLCGVRIKSSQATWMTDCDLIHQGRGIQIDPDGASGDLVTWCFFEDVACDLGAGDGIYINPNNATVKGLFFNNCWSSSNLNGVNVLRTGSGGVDGVYFDGCVFFNNKNRGGWNQSCANVEFVACKFSGNSGASAGTYPGLEIANSTSNFSITNCHSGSQSGFGATQSYGLLIGTGCDNYIVVGNNLLGNTAASAGDGSMGSSTQREVRENLGFRTISSGITTIASGTNVKSVTHNLAGTPTVAFAVPFNTNVGGLDIWCGSATASTFNINTSANTPSTFTFSWSASLYW